jgi:uncharacterized protein
MQNSLDTPNRIRTISGVFIDPFDIKPDQIRIGDIAHALAHQCRFGGHVHTFYSVAQHSIFMATRLVHSKEDKLAALLHDASEAYLLDIPSPVKCRIPGYKEAEENIMKVIAEKFGFQYPLSKRVKEADRAALEFEYEHIVLRKYGDLDIPFDRFLHNYNHQEITDQFLIHFTNYAL